MSEMDFYIFIMRMEREVWGERWVHTKSRSAGSTTGLWGFNLANL